jgi:hypothetical protein
MVDLAQLQQEIASLGEQIKTLKSASPVDKDAVSTAVQQLLEAKQLYADNNNGIGVDGKPFEAGKKGDKKKDKAAAPAASGKKVCTS